MTVIETRLGPVEYELDGDGGSTVLASHGGFGGVDQARLLLDWLPRTGYRRLAVSRPGFLSTPLAGRETPHQQADLFAALLDALEIDNTAVISLSSGGPAGYLFAARHPGRITALVAISAISGPHDTPNTAGPVTQAIFTSRLGQWLTEKVAQHKPAWMLREMFRDESTLPADQVDASVRRILDSPADLAWLRTFLSTMRPYRLRKPGTDNDTTQMRALDLPLGQIACPTLIVHGTHDADVPPEHAHRALSEIPAAEAHWIDHGSHTGFWLAAGAAHAQQTAHTFLTHP